MHFHKFRHLLPLQTEKAIADGRAMIESGKGELQEMQRVLMAEHGEEILQASVGGGVLINGGGGSHEQHLPP